MQAAMTYRAFSTDLDSELKAGAEAQALCLETEYAQQKLRAFVSIEKIYFTRRIIGAEAHQNATNVLADPSLALYLD